MIPDSDAMTATAATFGRRFYARTVSLFYTKEYITHGFALQYHTTQCTGLIILRLKFLSHIHFAL